MTMNKTDRDALVNIAASLGQQVHVVLEAA